MDAVVPFLCFSLLQNSFLSCLKSAAKVVCRPPCSDINRTLSCNYRLLGDAATSQEMLHSVALTQNLNLIMNTVVLSLSFWFIIVLVVV